GPHLHDGWRVWFQPPDGIGPPTRLPPPEDRWREATTRGGGGDVAQREVPDPGDRRVAHQGEDDPEVPAARLQGRGEHGSRPRPADLGSGDPREGEEGALGAARRERGEGLRPALRGAEAQDQ